MDTYKDSACAYWLSGGRLVRGRPEAFFPFLKSRGHVISLVGGGGKTTLLYHLADCFAGRGMRAAVMTTTKMGCPERYCEAMDACWSAWDAGGYAVCGQRLSDGKFRAPLPEFQTALLGEADAVVIEADGARRLPCKAPAAHEPVILPQTDIVIGVMGLDALGKPVAETCLRAQIVQELLGCDAQHRLTEADMAKILLSPQGTRKNVEHRDYFIVLNKCDDEERLARGRKLLDLLAGMGHHQAVLTAGMRRSETYEWPDGSKT